HQAAVARLATRHHHSAGVYLISGVIGPLRKCAGTSGCRRFHAQRDYFVRRQRRLSHRPLVGARTNAVETTRSRQYFYLDRRVLYAVFAAITQPPQRGDHAVNRVGRHHLGRPVPPILGARAARALRGAVSTLGMGRADLHGRFRVRHTGRGIRADGRRWRPVHDRSDRVRPAVAGSLAALVRVPRSVPHTDDRRLRRPLRRRQPVGLFRLDRHAGDAVESIARSDAGSVTGRWHTKLRHTYAAAAPSISVRPENSGTSSVSSPPTTTAPGEGRRTASRCKARCWPPPPTTAICTGPAANASAAARIHPAKRGSFRAT